MGICQQDVAQDAVFEEIHDLLLQQHSKVSQFFLEYTSAYEQINQKLVLNKTSCSGSSKMPDQFLTSSAPLTGQSVPPPPVAHNEKMTCEVIQIDKSEQGSEDITTGSSKVAKSKQTSRSVTLVSNQREESKHSSEAMTLVSKQLENSKQSGEDMMSWSQQLHLDEVRDRELAHAMCQQTFEGSEDDKGNSRRLKALERIVHSPTFELTVSIAIMTNAVLIGVETQYMAMEQLADPPFSFKFIGWSHAGFFFVELALRLVCEGVGFFKSRSCVWNMFDIFCVLCSLFEVIVDVADMGADVQNANVMRVVRMVRTLRLSRTIRITSLVRFVSALQILVQSIVATLKSLVWALVLMLMIVYICGVMFTQAVTNHVLEIKGEQGHYELLEYWGTLVISMSTLYQSVTGGLSWRDAALPLSNVSWIWELLFVAYVSFTYFAVLNVVTGVFCNSAIENARHEPDMLIQSLLADQEWHETHLNELFANLDKDGSGQINIRELEKSLSKPSVRAWFAAMGLEVTDSWTLFKLIDEDGSHDVSSQEFVARCMQLKGHARSIDLAQLRQEHKFMNRKLMHLAGRIESRMHEDQDRLRLLEQNLHAVSCLVKAASSIATPREDAETPPQLIPESAFPVAFLQAPRIAM